MGKSAMKARRIVLTASCLPNSNLAKKNGRKRFRNDSAYSTEMVPSPMSLSVPSPRRPSGQEENPLPLNQENPFPLSDEETRQLLDTLGVAPSIHHPLIWVSVKSPGPCLAWKSTVTK